MSKLTKTKLNPWELKEPPGQSHKRIVVELAQEMPSRGIVEVQTVVYIRMV
jgi:hypothetical protein